MGTTGAARKLGAAIVVGSAFASPARAAADDARAKTLFQEGLSLLDAKQDTAACAAFRESLAAEPSVGAMLNVAMCSTREDKLARAQEEYRALLVLNEATVDAERRKNVDARAREAMRSLSLRVPTLELSVVPAPEALEIELDGRPFERSRLGTAQAVDPGDHVIEVSAEGFVPLERRLTLREGERQVLALELLASRPAGAGGEDTDTRVVAGWVTGSTGVLGLAVGGALLGVAALRASRIEDLCGDGAEPPRCDPPSNAAEATDLGSEGRALEIGGWVSIGVGAGLVAAGAVVLGVSLGSRDVGVTLLPSGPSGPGLSLVGRF